MKINEKLASDFCTVLSALLNTNDSFMPSNIHACGVLLPESNKSFQMILPKLTRQIFDTGSRSLRYSGRPLKAVALLWDTMSVVYKVE